MNPVESHLRLNKSFVLSVLLSSHANLILLSQHAESIVYQDVVEIVRESAPQLEESDVIAHAALLFESSLEPKINAMGQIILRIKPDHILSIHSVVVKAFLDAICLRMKGEESSSVTDFKSQASISLQLHAEELARPRETDTASAITAAEQDAHDWHEGTRGQTGVPSVQGEEAPALAAISQAQQPTARPASLSLSDEFAMTFPTSAIAVAAAEVLESSSPPSAGDTDIEKSEPIVRLLAQVRKVGMDILFPQSVHDKVLACVFVSLRSGVALAHREIIDMVMAVKDSRVVSDIEAVSKTKVRGILALLKHGEMVTARGQEGEAIRLTLTPGIHSFRDLRDRHDAFLTRFMMEHQIFVPILVRAEVVWYLDTKEKEERLVFMERVLSLLHAYFSSTSSNRHHHHYQHHNGSRKNTDLSLRTHREGMGRTENTRGLASTADRTIGGASMPPFTMTMMQAHHPHAQRMNGAFAYEEPVATTAAAANMTTAYLRSPPRPPQHGAGSGGAYTERTAGDEAGYPTAYHHHESRAVYQRPGRPSPPSMGVYTDGHDSPGHLSLYAGAPPTSFSDAAYHQHRRQRPPPAASDRQRSYESASMSESSHDPATLATTLGRIHGSRGDNSYHNLPRRHPAEGDATANMASQYAQNAFTGRSYLPSSLIDHFGPRATPEGSRNTMDHPQHHQHQHQQQAHHHQQLQGWTQRRQRGMEMSYSQLTEADPPVLPPTAAGPPPSSSFGGLLPFDSDNLDARGPPRDTRRYDTFGRP